MVAPFYIYRHYFVRYDFGTIGGRSAENLLFISVFRVGEEFDSHHPLSFFSGKTDKSRLPAVFVLPGLIPGDTRILRGHIVNKTVNTSDIHDRTGRPRNRNGGLYADRRSRKRT